MTLLNTEKAELHQYYLVVGRQQRSHEGPTLERQWMGSPWECMADFVKHFRTCPELAPSEPYFDREPDGDVTANITAEQDAEPSTELSLYTIGLLGRVSTKLGKLCMRHRQALEAFHGDSGAVFESVAARAGMAALRQKRAPMYGRIASLFRLTRAGRELIRRAKDGDGKHLKLSENQLVQNAVAQDGDQATLSKAHEQALALLERAERAYARAGRGGPVEAPTPLTQPGWADAVHEAWGAMRSGPKRKGA